jgi:hypothetical protein
MPTSDLHMEDKKKPIIIKSHPADAGVLRLNL